uniref:Uncharacterized protein n=1 Tax=Setaria viridis TaxID=4556 RepID=A0A4U6UCZ9_SETVI|nr:hypothetical protein SEVIR_5G127500v2 [Setaria viridis]
METMRAEPVADGQPPLPSTDVVSKFLSQNSSNTTFLKNARIPTSSSKSQSAGEEAIQGLDSPKYGAGHRDASNMETIVQDGVVYMEREELYEELKKQQDESNVILMKILNLNTPGTSSQP